MTDRRKLIELASGKYFGGHDTSPMEKPNAAACVSISLSNTKSSEFATSGKVSSTRRVNAR